MARCEFAQESAAEVGEEPEEEREAEAQYKAGDDGEVERGVFAAMDDVTGEGSETKREFSAEIEEGAQQHKKTTEKKEDAAEFAERIHQTKSKSGMRAESKSDEQRAVGG
jgi:hypothetical protein